MATNNPNHQVTGSHNHRYKAGGEVNVDKAGYKFHDQLGEVIVVRNYDNNPKITVVFNDGADTAKFSPCDLVVI